jgi:hypothetical protein
MLSCVQDPHQVGVLQLGKQRDFVVEARWVGCARPEHFDRDSAVQPGVVASVHVGHPATGDQTTDPIAPPEFVTVTRAPSQGVSVTGSCLPAARGPPGTRLISSTNGEPVPLGREAGTHSS